MAKEVEGDHTQNGLVIFSDSQAALKALLRPRMLSRQIYPCGCNTLLQQLSNQGIDIEFRWIPAHEEIARNELVDRHAKEPLRVNPKSPRPQHSARFDSEAQDSHHCDDRMGEIVGRRRAARRQSDYSPSRQRRSSNSG